MIRGHHVYSSVAHSLTHLVCIGLLVPSPIMHPGNGQHYQFISDAGLRASWASHGRSFEYFDPYPHPVDLQAIFPDAHVIPLTQYETKDPSV